MSNPSQSPSSFLEPLPGEPGYGAQADPPASLVMCCGKCGCNVETDAQFCSECHTILLKPNSQPGHEDLANNMPFQNSPKAKRFCQYCGKAVTQQAVVCLSCGGSLSPINQEVATTNDSMGQPASVGAIVFMILAAMMVPAITAILGFINIFVKGKQLQGACIFFWSLFCGVIWLFVLAGLRAMNTQ